MNKRKYFLPVSILCMLSVSVPIVAAGSPDARDAREVLRRFAEARKNLNSFIVKGSSTRRSTTTRSGKGVMYCAFEHRYDGNRVKNIAYCWGDIGPDRNVKEKDAHYYMNLWDGETAYSFTKSKTHNKGKGTLKMSDKDNPGDYSKRAPEPFKGSAFGIVMGYHHGDKVPIGELFLGSSVKLQLGDKRSNLRGVDCYVIQADVPGKGNYTVWIDPVHDYHIARIRCRRGPGDRMGSEGNLLILKEGAIRTDSYEVVEFEKKRGAWFPKICKWKKYYTFPGYKSIDEKDLTFSEISLDPDHDALGSFLLDDVANGSNVVLKALPTRMEFLNRFVWEDGKVVDKDGREVDVDKLIKAESEKVKKRKPKRK